MANETTEFDDRDQRVLSIQSHVVSGYCGNKSAVFPLQTLGFDVDFINSVQFSTHTGYPKWTGQILNEPELYELIDGLRACNIIEHYTHLLTGYARSASFLQAMAKIIEEIKSKSSNVIYLCDPVMGDNGKMYVPEEILKVFKEQVIPLADILTPNQFEAELLTGVQITGMQSALKAIDHLHSLNVKTVVITSTDDHFDGTKNQLTIIGSTVQNSRQQKFRLVIPRIEANFTGTGDLFASLFIAWFTRTNYDLKTTMENVTATLQAIIRYTYHYASKMPNGLDSVFNRELKIIKCRQHILEPKVEIYAESI